MQPFKTIKIFLASSITELKNERKALGDYIMNSVRPRFKHDNIEMEVLKCEDIDKGNTGKNPQEKIDDLLRSSSISVFLFKKGAGSKTIHEFDVACEWQKKNPHKIYIFCYNLPEVARSKELDDFLLRLKKEEFYWETYTNIDYIEKELLHGLLDYGRELLGKPKNTEVYQETNTEKDSDTRFAEYQENENKQAQLREQLHQDIENLLKERKKIMADEEDTIAEKITRTIELYEKADLWADKTDYDKDKYSKLLFDFADFLYDFGLFHESEIIYLRQIRLSEDLFGTENAETATSYDKIGKVYSELWNNQSALIYYQKAEAIRERILGTDHPDTAETYNNIGLLLYRGNEFDRVLKHSQKLNATRVLAFLEMLKSNPRVVSKILKADYLAEKLASKIVNYFVFVIRLLSGDNHKRKKGLKYLFKALAIREKILGTDHPKTAASFNNIGLVYSKLGNHSKALEYYSKAMKIDERILGTDNHLTSIDYYNIGIVYSEVDNYEMALEYLFKALAIDEKTLGTNRPSTAETISSIGMVYKKQHNYSKALEYYEKALSIFMLKLGPTHPNTESARINVEFITIQKAILTAVNENPKPKKKTFWQRLMGK